MAIILYTFKEPLRVPAITRDIIEHSLLWKRHTNDPIPSGFVRDVTPPDYIPGQRLVLRTFTKRIHGLEDTSGEISLLQKISASPNGPEGGSSVETEEVINTEPINGTANESVIMKHIEDSTDVYIYSIIRHIAPKRSSHWLDEDDLRV